MVLAGSLAFGSIAGAAAQLGIDELQTQPIALQADQVTYDQELGLVTASGNVEVTQAGYVLKSDNLSYNQNTDTVTASGNVVLTEPSGNVVSADYLELRDELRNGVITNLQVLLTDNSRFTAESAEREDGNRTELEGATYTPCEVCEENPERPPLWRIRAAKVIHDEDAKTVSYRHAVLEFFGVPVAYTPYFLHPDPTVRRRSGLLAPTFRSSTELGFQLEVPFFWNIAPHRDMTISPRITSKEGFVLGAEYRERTREGQFKLDGSGTYVDERDDFNDKTGDKTVRGHIRSDGRFDINRNWRWGYEFFRASDDTYLRRYDISNQDVLTTNLFAERFKGRNYAAINQYIFQDLREELGETETPFILPKIDYNYVSEPGVLGGRFTFDADGLVLQRARGTDSRRISLTGAWELPYIGPLGSLFRLAARLRGDAYWVNAVDTGTPGENESGFTGRIWPVGTFDWSFPLVRKGGSLRITFEPAVSVVGALTGGNPNKIPNEDSLSFEFDDTNLFSHNRFAGLDRVESGSRANYGIRGGIYGEAGGYANFAIGQSYRFNDNDQFSEESGLAHRLSDIVGRVTLAPAPYLDLVYRFRADADGPSLRRMESYLSAGPAAFRIRLSYVRLAKELALSEFTRREEINVEARAKITKYWSILAEHRRDLEENEAIFTSAGIQYADECFDIRFQFERKNTRDRDVEESTNFGLRIRLKNLSG